MGDTGEAFEAFNDFKKEERSKKEPYRFEFAICQLKKLDVSYVVHSDLINIGTKLGQVDFYPFTGWFCGRKPIGNIKGRGINNLIAALKGSYNSKALV